MILIVSLEIAICNYPTTIPHPLNLFRPINPFDLRLSLMLYVLVILDSRMMSLAKSTVYDIFSYGFQAKEYFLSNVQIFDSPEKKF